MAELNPRQKRAYDAAHTVLFFVNDFCYDYKTFAHEICNNHPTLQQSVMRLFVELTREMAKKQPENVDERNEQAVELAKAILPIMNGHPLPFI